MVAAVHGGPDQPADAPRQFATGGTMSPQGEHFVMPYFRLFSRAEPSSRAPFRRIRRS
ncbi:hypothetical protein ACFYXJ_25550 [Streptomyces sp. NPDC002667]|uniref:hypothetical protein n=1 Tax=Streptomyces sp. NPDC002667 TaxID=3364657 RepID=UPI003677C218